MLLFPADKILRSTGGAGSFQMGRLVLLWSNVDQRLGAVHSSEYIADKGQLVLRVFST